MENSIDLYQECDAILERIPTGLTNDQKMRYLYLEVGKLLSKSPEFFYDKDPVRQSEIYNNYKVIQDREVVCRSVTYLYCNLGAKLGLNCRPIEMDDVEGIKFNHWAIVYENEDKKYLINPIPDFYRVQLGFTTKSFCHTEDYHFCSSETFDSMSDEYLRELDESLGYLSSGLYTDELFEKLSTEMRSKLGMHIVRTSDYYQEYYLKLLELIQNNKISMSEKLEVIAEIDPELDKHQDIIEKTLETKLIDKDMKKIIHNLSYRKLINTEVDFSKSVDGADFIGSMDVTNLKEMKKDIMLYKFNYMMNCIPKYTTDLTGYIENKNFMEELGKYFFQMPEEKQCIHRHTVVQKKPNGKNDYYLMFSVKDLDEGDSFYCFYNHKDKTFQMPIEPISFMLENDMRPLKNSTLNEKISYSTHISKFCTEPITTVNQIIIKKSSI